MAICRIDVPGLGGSEHRDLLGHHWWPVTDVNATAGLVFPAGLLRRLLAGDPAPELVCLLWT